MIQAGKRFLLQVCFGVMLCGLLTGCNSSSSKDQQTSDIPEMFLEEDTMIEYETTFDLDDTSITEIYQDENGEEHILNAEGETTVEVEIPEE